MEKYINLAVAEMKLRKTKSKMSGLYRQRRPVKTIDCPPRETRGNSYLKEDHHSSSNGSLRCIELFAGAGGLALAASKAGFKHDAVVEINAEACETILANQRNGYTLVSDWPVVRKDIRLEDFMSWNGRTDLVCGGPPCQPFSIGGKHRAMQDERNLFPEAARVIRQVSPKAFIFENVKGLTREAFAKYFSYIVLQLSFPEIVRQTGEDWMTHLSRLEKIKTEGTGPDLRYHVVWRLLNAADYGVPQRRERVFFVGFRSDIQMPWSFPNPTHSRFALQFSQAAGDYWERHGVPTKQRHVPVGASQTTGDESFSFFPRHLAAWRTVRDAIVDLGEPARRSADAMVPNHVLQPGARSYAGHTGSPLDEPSKTLKAGDHGVPGGENMLRYPDGSVRYFSVRESCRLQTFPDEYIFNGCWTENMRQIGNAVPVTLGEVVLSSVKKILERQSVQKAR
jgi:DNA (cytosine-5)-methyltransferase 1